MKQNQFVASSGNVCEYTILRKDGVFGVGIGWGRKSSPEDQQEFETFMTPVLTAMTGTKEEDTQWFSSEVQEPGAKPIADVLRKVLNKEDPGTPLREKVRFRDKT